MTNFINYKFKYLVYLLIVMYCNFYLGPSACCAGSDEVEMGYPSSYHPGRTGVDRGISECHRSGGGPKGPLSLRHRKDV